MAHEIESFSLNGLSRQIDPNRVAKDTLNQPNSKTKMLWKHPNIDLLGYDPRPIILGLEDDGLSVLKKFSQNTPTSHRTLCFDVNDNYGSAKYVVKGTGLTPNKFTGVDVLENTDYIHNRRFGSVDSAGEAGRESVSAAGADIGGFMELAKLNSNILFDFNGPIWQPLSVVNTGETMIEGDNVWTGKEWRYLPFAQFSAIDIRRFAYTHFRIEDISFDSAKSLGEEEFAKLAKLWNLPDRKQVYLRSIKRWAQASRMFIDSQVRHCQVFDFFTHKQTGLQYAWINPNNVSLDGGTGDMDCTRKYIDKWRDNNRGRLEAVGGLIIYLYGAYKLDSQLVENNEFLHQVLDIFFANLGMTTAQTIKQNRDFVKVSELCKNSRMLYNLNTPNREFMPGRSPYEENKNMTEILPFMERVSMQIDQLIH